MKAREPWHYSPTADDCHPCRPSLASAKKHRALFGGMAAAGFSVDPEALAAIDDEIAGYEARIRADWLRDRATPQQRIDYADIDLVIDGEGRL